MFPVPSAEISSLLHTWRWVDQVCTCSWLWIAAGVSGIAHVTIPGLRHRADTATCPQVVNIGSTLRLFGCFDVAGDAAVNAAVVGVGNFGGGTVGGISTSSVVRVASAVCVATGGAAAAGDVAVHGVAGGDAALGCIVISSAFGDAVVDADVVGAVVIGGVAAGDAVVSVADFGGGAVSCDTDGSIAVDGAASGRVVVGGYAAAVGGGAAVDSTVNSDVGIDGAGVGVP